MKKAMLVIAQTKMSLFEKKNITHPKKKDISTRGVISL